MALVVRPRLLFALLLMSHSSSCSNFQGRQVCIVPDSIGSTSGGQGLSCETSISISKFCQEDELHSHTIATVLEGTHTLNSTCEFKNATNLAIRGNSIQFIGCGSVYRVTSSQLDGLANETLAALLFINGSNLSLSNLSVTNSKSAGLYVYNVAAIDSCTVANASSRSLHPMSGSVIVYDNSTKSKTNFRISQSYFVDSGYAGFEICLEDHVTSYSSGLALFVGNQHTTVSIADTHLSNNMGCNGGNMALLLFDYLVIQDPQQVTVSTNFTHGRGYIGGGLYVSFKNSFVYSTHKSNISQAVNIVGSRFVRNFAGKNGGGVYIQWKQTLNLDEIVDMDITGSLFEGNSIGHNGSGGLALNYKTYLDAGDEAHSLPKFRVNLHVSKCVFRHHSPNSTATQLLSESSVILAKSAPYIALHNITVTSNECTAILALGSTLVFSGSSLISGNNALAGGGIRLCTNALVYLTPHTDLVITNNTAQQTGGGILVNSNCLVNIPMCFYQYSRKISQTPSLLDTINVRVYNNSAPLGGSNIYGGSVDYCYLLYIRRNDKRFTNKIQFPNNTVDNPSSISSNPLQVCFNRSCDPLLCFKKKSIPPIYPGQNFTASVRVVGQILGAVSGTVLASLAKDEASIHSNEEVQSVDILGRELNYTVFSMQQEIEPGREIHLNLEVYTVSDSNIHEYIRRFPPAVVKINFKKCPFGFKLSNVSTTSVAKFACTCMSVTHAPIEECSIDQQTIQKRAGAWVGMFSIDNHTYLATSAHCPLDYCHRKLKYIHSSTSGLDQDWQCRYNRTGTLCGSCPPGWSLILGSLECREKCSLLLIVPFAVMGFLLVLVIHFLNMTVTVGTINGLIFYANIIQDYSIVLFQRYPVVGLTPVLQTFIAWFNLDLGVPTCFYDGMSAFGKNMILGAFPVYIWLISVVIILLSHRYISITKLVGKNAVNVLATLFLLSYSKMLRVTIGTLNVRILHIHIDSGTTISKLRWILDGNIAFFDLQKHFALIIISVFFISPSPSLSFACIQRVYSLSTCCRIFSRIDKLKPFFDTYTGPFKDKARFWTGLLLLTRLLLLMVHTTDYRNTKTPFYIILMACLVLASLMVFMNGIYKKHHLNVLECFFVLNLGLVFLSLISIEGGVASHLLVGISLLVFLAYHIYLKLSPCDRLWRRPAFWSRRVENFDVKSFEGMRGFDEADRDTSEDEDVMIEASDRLVHFPPMENLSYDNYERSRSFSSKPNSRKS